MDWSYQLYSSRNFQPWSKVFETLRMIGYRNVEGFGGIYRADMGPGAGSLKDELDRNELSMPSGHFSIDQVEEFSEAYRIARLLGIKLVACPHIAAEQRPADAEGWRAFGRRLGAAGKKFQDSGLGFAWHNHDFEFAKLPDGSVPMTHILESAPDIGWEIDVAWVIRGGADPKKWIADHADRIVAVHVKDIAPAGQNTDQDGWADVGHGTVDWKGLYALLRERTKASYFIMEHDNPSDAARFARLSFASAQNL